MTDPIATSTSVRGSALAGMTVLDLTQVMAGPYCTMLLADFGADVIKIENPIDGDQSRRSWGRPGAGEDSRAFMALNRNKRSVTIDLKTTTGLNRFLELVDTADVVIENFRPGVADRLGVGYEAVSARNPGIVYASISGFGQDGPYATRPGYDLIAQAMGGAMSITGESGGRPVKCGLPVADLGAGLFTTIGILTAWTHRQRTGEGQYLETSLFETVIAMSVWESVEYWTTGKTPQPMGSGNRMAAPYQALATRDGYITVGANNQKLWRTLCQALDAGALAEDARFLTNADRMENRAELVQELENRLASRDTETWVRILLEAGVPAGPIQDYRRILTDDPHVQARGLVQTLTHPSAGSIPVVGSPIRMSATPASIYRHPPLLGEHDDEVFEVMGQVATASQK
jgi:crotonobetainyl-CoA:carnitine CoA-transferase CaiB-like acyl-CoA transferase